MFGFEKLDVWGKAIEFADDIYRITKRFPIDERFGLTSQLRRAAVSISSNIAEGSGRHSKAEFSRFLAIAYGSLMECVSQLHICRRQELIESTEFTLLVESADTISRMLSGLRRSLTREP